MIVAMVSWQTSHSTFKPLFPTQIIHMQAIPHTFHACTVAPTKVHCENFNHKSLQARNIMEIAICTPCKALLKFDNRFYLLLHT